MKILLSLLFSVLLIACVSRRKDFTYYKKSAFIEESTDLRLDGMYFIVNRAATVYGSDYFFLYADGTAYSGGQHFSSDDFWSDPEYYIKEKIKVHYQYSQSEKWGSFIVRGDSIYIQNFVRYTMRLKMRDITEVVGIIKNDSTIVLSKRFCPDCIAGLPSAHVPGYDKDGFKAYDPPIEYRFVPSTFKPDSSLAWYREKKWYQEGLHESRK